MFPTIEIFGRTVGSYAIFAFLGFIACGTAITFLCKRIKIAFEDSVILILVVAAGLLIGGHLLYGFVNLAQNKQIIEKIFNSSLKTSISLIIRCFGGMIFYGGFLGGLASLGIYYKFSNTAFKEYIFDIYAFSIPLFHFFGRIGCFFAGCCYGIESEFGFTVTDNKLVPDINGINRFPISLLEAICNLLLFILLAFLFSKRICEFKLINIYMILYSIIRFCTEFLRGDIIRGFVFGISTSQWISIFLFVFAILTLGYKKIPKKA